MAAGESFQRPEYGNQPAEQEPEAVTHDDQIGVVGDEGAGSAQMKKGARCGRLVSKGVNMSHDVMPETTLIACGRSQVRAVEMSPHLAQGRFRNVQPELALRFGQGQPQPAPESDPVWLAPQRLHGGRGIPGAEGRLPTIATHRNTRSVKVTWA